MIVCARNFIISQLHQSIQYLIVLQQHANSLTFLPWSRIAVPQQGISLRSDQQIFALAAVKRDCFKGRDIEVESRSVPWLKPWSIVRIPAGNRIDFQQQGRVEIQDGTAAEAHGEAVGTPHGDPGFHHAAQHHVKTGSFRHGCHEDPVQQPAFGNFNIDVVRRPVPDNGLEVTRRLCRFVRCDRDAEIAFEFGVAFEIILSQWLFKEEDRFRQTG